MTEDICSSVTSVEEKIPKKKKHNDTFDTGAVGTISTTQQCRGPIDTGQPIQSGSLGGSNTLEISSQGAFKTKKKKKNKKSKPIGIEKGPAHLSKEGEGEDAAESIDSGCIADAPGDMGELTDWPQVEAVILEENKFVSSLLTWLPVLKEDEAAVGYVKRADNSRKSTAEPKKSLNDLEKLRTQHRRDLEALQQSRKNKPWDSVSKRKEAKLNKKLSNINKVLERRARQMGRLSDSLLGGDTLSVKTSNKKSKVKHQKNSFDKYGELIVQPSTSKKKPQKPIYNKNGELVFSKFDFSENSQDAYDDPKPKDLKQMLSKALKEKEKAKQLQEKGLKDAAVDLVEKRAWTSALQKAEGVKVRDDVEMLKHSIKKKEARKKASQKKWDARIKSVEQKKLDRDSTRAKNLGARKDSKLKKKIGKMKKKGHIVPGF